MSRKLAEGWAWGLIRANCWRADGTGRVVSLPIICQDFDLPGERVYFAHAAPDSCFAESAPEAKPDALPALDERVYVADGHVAGWATAKGWDGTGKRVVIFDVPPRGHLGTCFHVKPAACHREGPHFLLPEGGIFLGRFRDHADAFQDTWWLNGCICIRSGEEGGLTPEQISVDRWYIDALAVARALGLVKEPAAEEDVVRVVCDGCGEEAPSYKQPGNDHVLACVEPPELCGRYVEVEVPAEVEPKRPEQKFVLGQRLAHARSVTEPISDSVQGIVWGPDSEHSAIADSAESEQWWYAFAPDDDWWPESDLAACAPVLTQAQRDLRPGDVVRCVEIPVGTDGVPCGRPSEGEFEIREVHLRPHEQNKLFFCPVSPTLCMAWNFVLVRKAADPA